MMIDGEDIGATIALIDRALTLKPKPRALLAREQSSPLSTPAHL
jgi:hypothetical protein